MYQSGQDLHNISIIQDGMGKYQHNTGVEEDMRKTLNGLKWQKKNQNATSSQVLGRTLCNTHDDEEILLMLP